MKKNEKIAEEIIRRNLYHDWNGYFAFMDGRSNNCGYCNCPPRRKVIKMVVDEVYKVTNKFMKEKKKYDCGNEGCGECEICEYLDFLEYTEAVGKPSGTIIERHEKNDKYLYEKYGI